MELFCVNKQRVKPVGCFRTGGSSLMFDGILNVTLSEEVSTLGDTQLTESWRIYVRAKELS